jgi:diadenylate cyclase
MSASLLESIKAYFLTLSGFGYFLTILDVLIVAILIYYAFVLIKGTRATRIIYGIILLVFVLALGRALQLQTLNWLLSHLTTLILVAIPIVFQPELRRGLERLGRIKIFKPSSIFLEKTSKEIIQTIVAVCQILTKNKIGGLIAIKKKTGLDDIIETGEKIEARLSIKLLLNIFFPDSPLHDGAVIISGNKILAAGCTLPLTEDEKFYMYGTRHRAAIGLSEETDAVCIVISEEKKAVSLAVDGKIKQISLQDLEKSLLGILKEK